MLTVNFTISVANILFGFKAQNAGFKTGPTTAIMVLFKLNKMVSCLFKSDQAAITTWWCSDNSWIGPLRSEFESWPDMKWESW